MKLINQSTNIIACLLLLLMFCLAFFSLPGDSATMDELAHIPAGYAYITQKDMRLNPEHPPLLKDLAGLAVLFGSKLTATPIHFPSQIKAWQEDINGQWDFGAYFLYQSGNEADKIIFWARLPMLLIMLILGFYIFKWARELYGNKAGLLALFLYSLCPTFLAHSRLVTTDVGAAAAFFIATYYFLKWLKQPHKKNLIIAGLIFSLAMLTKFSLILLIPYFVFLVVVWVLIKKDSERLGKCLSATQNFPARNFVAVNCSLSRFKGCPRAALESTPLKGTFPRLPRGFQQYLISLLLIGLIGLALIWPIYQYHVWNYPPVKQQVDTEFILQSFGNRTLANLVVWMADKPILRAYGQYFLGLFMVMQRAVGGNTTYFLGEVSAAGWKHYFPVVYAIKIPLAMHCLTILTCLFLAWQIKKPFWNKPFRRFLNWSKKYFIEFSMLIFLILYWALSLKSNLNIGVRHLLPTFPFLYVLVSGQIIKMSLRGAISQGLPKGCPRAALGQPCFARAALGLPLGLTVLIMLLAWYAYSSVSIYPHYLAYFNELVKGPNNGYQYVVDSNLDWGQDLKRLAQWVDQQKIEQIKVDYFGGSSPEYYLGDKFIPLHSHDGPQKGWLAISATFYQTSRQELETSYIWLDQYQPLTKIGYSIFVYQIP